MNDVGPELRDRLTDRAVRKAERQLGIHGQRHAAYPDHWGRAVGRVSWTGRDDKRIMPTYTEMVGQVADGVRDSVDLREE
ncbi:hypothetical protein GCM10027569_43850 [Flindersiella endophytica]